MLIKVLQKVRKLEMAYASCEYALQKSQAALSFAWEQNKWLERARTGSLDALPRSIRIASTEQLIVAKRRKYAAVVLDGNAAKVSQSYSQ